MLLLFAGLATVLYDDLPDFVSAGGGNRGVRTLTKLYERRAQDQTFGVTVPAVGARN